MIIQLLGRSSGSEYSIRPPLSDLLGQSRSALALSVASRTSRPAGAGRSSLGGGGEGAVASVRASVVPN